MDKRPKVSVMMVTYNQEKYIDEAIRSVVLQDFDYTYELIIGDDCSTDGTLARCHAWQQKYPDLIRIVEHSNNVGIQRNYIDTYNQCRGEYIAICEGDDFWCSRDKLKRQVKYMDTHNECNICFHRVFNYYTSNKSISLSNGGKQKEDSTIIDLARSNYITNLSVMYRRDNRLTLPEWLIEIHSPDYVLHMLHVGNGTIHYISKPMAVYRQHAQGIWGSNVKEKQLIISLNSRRKLIEYFKQDKEVSNNLIKAYNPIAMTLVLHYIEMGENTKVHLLKNEILGYNPLWDERILNQYLEARKRELSTSGKSIIGIILKKCRTELSKLLPVPRIKN